MEGWTLVRGHYDRWWWVLILLFKSGNQVWISLLFYRKQTLLPCIHYYITEPKHLQISIQFLMSIALQTLYVIPNSRLLFASTTLPFILMFYQYLLYRVLSHYTGRIIHQRILLQLMDTEWIRRIQRYHLRLLLNNTGTTDRIMLQIAGKWPVTVLFQELYSLAVAFQVLLA